ncbi:aminoglycoside/choline kinase family phosphotransferase [Pseudomonas sp. 2957]|jgi:aminoglycoside/choline kinase family phosphotransferase|uniref:N-acetylmuramate/N-acetylglucosamine kinase n=1 Tax=Pseudomonas fluorescens TaxID=294 RepID=A0A5E7KL83_PSEFL|nr:MULTISPECIES: phosphotransferase [Pseudomonas]MDR6949035.1 aminoglycoside/choline kinase family phosphotransferase [Pseudomonas sp. 2957]UST73971.1 phosphotransferase [Pseudomonas siliginis]UST95001.1 phosphotransferase [Pseudomonas siliginis]USU00165.1 phosphotransferase [Pseudomonas siliginis]VVP02722.1 N-acetylmuramate/N-acetylglucosamine kinase [Pseudomonas fluorescens]
MPDQDVRLQHLKVWLDEQLAKLFAEQGWGTVPPATLTAASSDASFRRYFRWEGDGRSFVVMDAPPPQENCKPFVDIAFLLAKSGINVPKIYAEDLERGFLLLNDLGNKTYLDVIDGENADALFHDALQALLAFQQLPMVAPLPSYDVALLRRELELFPEWYVKHELGVEFDAAQQQQWQHISELLIDSALAQPKVLVHRDYMPRNLMLSEPNPGVLDFQDAVYGPVTYDVTCLFKDAFLSWPEERVRGWLESYWQQASALDIPVQADFEDFLRASDLMGVQRHLKVIGIFARICHRDGKPRYLADVPRFFSYIEAVIARRPELAELQALFSSLRAGATA